jgi:hypothetical protein
MIYLFGKGDKVSIVFDGKTLTEDAKKEAIQIKELPKEETPENHFAALCLDDNNKPYWKYEKKPKETLEELVIKGSITEEQYKTLTGKDFTF